MRISLEMVELFHPQKALIDNNREFTLLADLSATVIVSNLQRFLDGHEGILKIFEIVHSFHCSFPEIVGI